MSRFILLSAAIVCLVIPGRTLQACDASLQKPVVESRKGWNDLPSKVERSFLGYMTLSPDGKSIITSGLILSGPDILFLHEVRPGARTRFLVDESGTSYSVAFSPDGKTFACGFWNPRSPDGESGILTLRDVQSGKIIWSHNAHLWNVSTLSFSPDGKLIVTGSWDETIKLWDAKTGKLIKTLLGHEHNVYSVRFSPDGKTLASGSQDGTVRTWDVRTGKERLKLHGHTLCVNAVAFSPDGRILASAGADKKITFWDAKTGNQVLTLEGHKDGIRCLSFSPDGKTLATGSRKDDGTIKLWDTQKGTEKQTLKVDIENKKFRDVLSLAFTPDGKTLITSRKDGKVRFWDVKSGTFLRTLKMNGLR